MNSCTINRPSSTIRAGMEKKREFHIGAEEAKDMELDEEARPTKKAGNTQVPSPETGHHKRIKGTRKA